MKISTRGQYSFEALLCIATEDPDQPCSLPTISEKTHISDGYLEQLFIPLKKAKLIVGSRGIQGGYRLAKSPKEISAYEVLTLMEKSLKSIPCLNGDKCEREKICDSKFVWASIDHSIDSLISQITLDDLIQVYRGVQGEFYG